MKVHCIPVYLHPFYQERFDTGPGHCPVAEIVYEQIVSLPIFPGRGENDVESVICPVSTLCHYDQDNVLLYQKPNTTIAYTGSLDTD